MLGQEYLVACRTSGVTSSAVSLQGMRHPKANRNTADRLVVFSLSILDMAATSHKVSVLPSSLEASQTVGFTGFI